MRVSELEAYRGRFRLGVGVAYAGRCSISVCRAVLIMKSVPSDRLNSLSLRSYLQYINRFIIFPGCKKELASFSRSMPIVNC